MKTCFSFFLGIFCCCTFFAFAQTVDNQLVDTENKVIEKSLQFKQFSSCKDIDTVLSKYVDIFKKYNKGLYERGGGIEMAEDSFKSTELTKSAMEEGISPSSTLDFSQTNLQKAGVEEPEIFKTDGKYLYYYNQNENKIYVVASPLDFKTSTLNFKNVKILTIINIPDGWYGIQLFTTKNRLIILGNKYFYGSSSSLLNRSQTTSIAIYDTTIINTPKLLKYVDVDGYFFTARMIGNKLYVISELNLDWSYYLPYKTKTSKLMPKVVETSNKKKKEFYAQCHQVSYLLPNEETIKKYNILPNLTLVSVLDVLNTKKQTVLHVNLATPGQIHMSKKNFYLLQNLYFYRPWPCPRGAFCILPVYFAGEQTLIHKFKLDGYTLSYKKSALVPGTLLTQYSMDEDDNENFRILTQKWDYEAGTYFYALNSNLELKGKIEKIAQGEQFKSSRYIGDKLYLVTFRQIDPLFVIDVSNLSQPKIIGELKIPGYSTYLHPLKNSQKGIQYLVGLGYDIGTGNRGATVNSGIKLSLYEVNYNLKDPKNPDYIKVSELSSMTLGGEGSWSEALENPRMFVMDKKNTVTLPLLLQNKSKSGENCSVVYSETGIEVSRYCYPIEKWNLNFAGLKSFSFDINNGIREVFSKNYSELFAKLKGTTELQSRDISSTYMRVGYVGDSLYIFNTHFADFILPNTNQSQLLYFNTVLKK